MSIDHIYPILNILFIYLFDFAGSYLQHVARGLSSCGLKAL